MKELQIIIKPKDDGNPLNQEIGREPEEGRMTVGWKMFADDGEAYGAYISMPDTDSKKDVQQAVKVLLENAYATDQALIEQGGGTWP